MAKRKMVQSNLIKNSIAAYFAAIEIHNKPSISVPGRTSTFSTKTTKLGHWERDLTIRGTRKDFHKIHTPANQALICPSQKLSAKAYADHF